MDLTLAICLSGSSKHCANRIVITVGERADSLGRSCLAPCPFCGGKTMIASQADRDHYRARLEAEAALREMDERKGGKQ